MIESLWGESHGLYGIREDLKQMRIKHLPEQGSSKYTSNQFTSNMGIDLTAIFLNNKNSVLSELTPLYIEITKG